MLGNRQLYRPLNCTALHFQQVSANDPLLCVRTLWMVCGSHHWGLEPSRVKEVGPWLYKWEIVNRPSCGTMATIMSSNLRFPGQGLVTTGYLHTPITASEPFGNPPVTWARSSDLGSWVETIKYAVRTSGLTFVIWDDDYAIGHRYTPPFPGAETTILARLYSVSEAQPRYSPNIW